MIVTAIIAFTVITLCFIICYFNSKTPQNNCHHDMDTINTWNGDRSKQYLSTCKKCGKQETHTFCGLNGFYN